MRSSSRRSGACCEAKGVHKVIVSSVPLTAENALTALERKGTEESLMSPEEQERFAALDMIFALPLTLPPASVDEAPETEDISSIPSPNYPLKYRLGTAKDNDTTRRVDGNTTANSGCGRTARGMDSTFVPPSRPTQEAPGDDPTPEREKGEGDGRRAG
jgi:hypothetical protein